MPIEKHNVLIPNMKYNGLNPIHFGYGSCFRNHCFGPATRTNWVIHFVVSGDEKIGYADVSTLKVTDVNEEKDMIYLEGEGDNVYLGEGDFMITFPQDAHMPCVMAKESKLCCKLIAKIRI